MRPSPGAGLDSCTTAASCPSPVMTTAYCCPLFSPAVVARSIFLVWPATSGTVTGTAAPTPIGVKVSVAVGALMDCSQIDELQPAKARWAIGRSDLVVGALIATYESARVSEFGSTTAATGCAAVTVSA